MSKRITVVVDAATAEGLLPMPCSFCGGACQAGCGGRSERGVVRRKGGGMQWGSSGME